MRNTVRLLISCLVFLGACSHSSRPATTAAAAFPPLVAARSSTQGHASTHAAGQAEAGSAVVAQAEVTTPADATQAHATQVDAPSGPAPRHAETAHHAFAPSSQTAAPEATCGEARVAFGAGSSALDAQARARLDAYVACVSGDEARAVYISGTTDPGMASTNMALANARARAVADYLRQGGLHMDFEVTAYRAGSVGPVPAVRHVGRSAIVTTVSPHRAVSR
jgi:outer membrane protein OmpA-like peptidoglycan-associated protein